MNITVHDIATKSGFSQSTVSKVLNNYPNVKESTRRKILAVIDELEYTPNLIARSMVKDISGTIGLIVGDIANPFFSETSKVIISNAGELGIDVIISDTDYNASTMKKAMSTMLARKVDGIIISSIDRDDTNIDKLIKDQIPLILYNRKTDNNNANYVVLDNELGIKMAVEHLLTLGHRKIAFISGSHRYSTFFERSNGFIKAMKSNNLYMNKDYIYERDQPEQHLNEFIDKMIEMDDKPTSFIAASDSLAIKTIEILLDRGYKVPEDYSVIGFDDINIASNPQIGLTTISQQKELMAKRSLEELLKLINNEVGFDKSIHVTIEPKLIIRKTTKSLK